jgi:hypothetical protein
MADGEGTIDKEEFVDPQDSYDWRTEGVKPPGGSAAIVYRDERSGTYCRVLSLPEGFTGGTEPLAHDCDEIVFIASGTLINTRSGRKYGPGSIAVFPAGTRHGPFTAPDGALTIEFRHYPRD